MRTPSRGFTLIELLIVIAIIGALAALLVPNLLAARARSFDAGAQACLKEVATSQEAFSSDAPFTYDAAFDPATVDSCSGVTFSLSNVTDALYEYEAQHDRGSNTYRVETGTAVTPVP